MALDSPKDSNVVTLEPYSLSLSRPLPQRNRRNRGTNPKLLGNEFEVLPGLSEPRSYSRYSTMKFDNQRAEESDMFKICREITTICGREPKISFQNDGSILIEVVSPEESEKLQSLEIITGIKTSCSPHKFMNRCKGVIRSRHLMKYSEERLQEEFKDQKVVEVKQMMRKIDGILSPLPTYVLTFDLLRLPRELKAAWLRLEVRPYIPSPRRCFYCQRFGHVSDSCRRKLKGGKRICSNCGKEDHGDCDNPSYCVNCNESHPATSKYCERYQLEREIQTIRSKEHVTFQEAKRRVMTRFIRPGVSYASVINKTRKVSMPENTNSSPITQNNAALKDKTPVSHTKRRRSVEEQDSSPSCKSNRFEVLIDEVEDNIVDSEHKLDNDLRSLDQDVTPALVSSTVRAEVHVSACSVEQADTAASVDLGESAEAFSLPGPGESAEEISSPMHDLGEPPGAESLPVLDTARRVKFEKCPEKDKTPRIDKADNTKSGIPIPTNRTIKIPRNKLGLSKLKNDKTDAKSSPGRPSVKESSRFNK